MFLPQDPLESGLYPDGSLEQYAGSIVFPAKPRTNPAEFGKIARNRRHPVSIPTLLRRAGGRLPPDFINPAAQ